LALDAGLENIEIHCTPWFLYPNPTLTPAERAVLLKIVEILHGGSVNRIGQKGADAWLAERIAQINNGTLVGFVNYFSLSANKPA
jgi:hypothetical protein